MFIDGPTHLVEPLFIALPQDLETLIDSCSYCLEACLVRLRQVFNLLPHTLKPIRLDMSKLSDGIHERFSRILLTRPNLLSEFTD